MTSKPKEKWSSSRSEGLILKRITTAINNKTSAEALKKKDIDELLEIGRKMAYISMQKSNLAKNTDMEERLEKLEKARKFVEEKQEEIELKARQQGK